MKIVIFSLLLLASSASHAAFFCYYLIKGDTIIASYDPPYDLTYPQAEPLSMAERKRREDMGDLIIAIDDAQCDGKTVVVDEN